MRKFLLLTAVVFFSNLCFTQSRITGGFNLNIAQAPWQVLLENNGDYNCGGSIIAPNYILTAKHCVIGISPNELKVITGITCKNEITNANRHNVSHIILHPTLDVALLRLATPISYNAFQQAISFVGSLNNLYYNAENIVRVSGWGWLTPDGYNPSNCLQGVDVNIITNETANEILTNNGQRILTENEFATIGVGFIRQGACHSDSGGPLSIFDSALDRNILLGIVSWGIPNCWGNNDNSPSIFVRVSTVVNWIYSNILSISGPSTLCDQAIYTIDNFPEGATVQWSTSNGNITFDSEVEPDKALFRQSGFNNSEIRAVITFNSTIIANLTLPVSICQPTISIPELICMNDSVHCSIYNIPSNMSVSWGAYGPLTIISGQNTSDAILYAEEDFGYETVIYADIFYNEQKIHTEEQLTYLGVPVLDYMECDYPSLGNWGEVAFYFRGYPTYYEWNKLAGSFFLDTSGSEPNRVGIVPSTSAPIRLQIKAYNACGFSAEELHYSPANSFNKLSLSPNPADSQVTINFPEDTNKDMKTVLYTSTPYTIQLWSSLGLVKTVQTDQPEYQLDLTGVAPGFYYVHVIKDGQTYRQQLVVR